MAVKIRLTRIGSKKNPIYRVVVTDAGAPARRAPIETIGRYVPAGRAVARRDRRRARHAPGSPRARSPREPVKKLLKIAGV